MKLPEKRGKKVFFLKKRIVTLSLALIFTLALFVPAYAAESETLTSQGFDDIAPGSWCDEAARWAVEKGITNGTGGNNFSPTRTCSRAEIITFLWRAAGAPTGFDVGYSDVDEGEWYSDAAAWCKAKQLITDDTFDGNADCTRADVVTYLWTLAEQPPAPYKYAVLNHHTLFEDIDANGELIDPVLWAVAYDITTGTSETTFSPDNTCTRGEIVTFIQRAFEQNIAGLSRPLYTTEPIPLDEYVENMPKGIGLTLGTSQVGLQEPGKYLRGEERFDTIEYVESDCYVDFGNGVIAEAISRYNDSKRFYAGYSRNIDFTFNVEKNQTVTVDITPFLTEGKYVDVAQNTSDFKITDKGNGVYTIKLYHPGYWGLLEISNEDSHRIDNGDSYTLSFRLE